MSEERPARTGHDSGNANDHDSSHRPSGSAATWAKPSCARSLLAALPTGLLGGWLAFALDPQVALAQADDWSVTRSEFDPRLVSQLKEQLRRHPDDTATLKRLCGLYRRYQSLDKLLGELTAVATRSAASIDSYLAGQVAEQAGKPAEATALYEQAIAQQKTAAGKLDTVQLVLRIAELAQKRTPPDYPEVRRQLERAGGTLSAQDPRRKAVLRKQVELALAVNDHALAEQALTTLVPLLQGAEAQQARRDLADALARAGKNKEALAEWQKLEAALSKDAVKRTQALLRIGELSEAQQDDLAAISTYRRALSVLPAGHYMRREVYEHLIAVHRKRDELAALLTQLETEWPKASRSFADSELLGRLYDERGDTPSAIASYRAALRKDPHSVDVRRRLLAILERSGVTSEVLAEYEQLIAQSPGDSRAYLELAERQERLGQRAKALATLKRAATRFQGDPSLHSALADLYQRWGEADLALSESELLVRLDPREESYIVNLGELYWARGRKDKADEVWKRLLNLAPGGSRAMGQARLAEVYVEHNLMPQAMDLYQKAVRSEPANLQLRRGLALCTERLKRPMEAVSLWEQLYFAAKAPTERLLRMEARQHIASLVGKDRKLGGAFYSWQRRFQAQVSAAALDPMDASELLALGLLVAECSLQLSQPSEAESVLLQLRDRQKDGPVLAEVLLALVQVYRQQRKLEPAIAALKQAAALLPERRRELYAQLAELSMQGYHDEDAIHYAQQAVTDAQGELRLGELLERRDDIVRAMAAYKRAIELDSRQFRAHMALGRLHLQRGELAQAAALYREVVRRTPQEDLILEAGRKAIDLSEYLGTLGELSRELLPLSYSPLPKPAYRKLLVLLFERYASPLLTLAATGDAAAAAELSRLGQSGLKPLTETLVEGDAAEQRTAIALLGQMKNPSAVPALLSIVTGGASQAGKPGSSPGGGPSGSKDDSADGRVVLGTSGPRAADIELRTEALYAAAQLADPSSLKTLTALSQSREKQLRLGGLYGLIRLTDKLEPSEVLLLEQAIGSDQAAVRGLGCLGVGQRAGTSGLTPRAHTLLTGAIERWRLRPDETYELATAACVHALGRARDVGAVPLLTTLLQSGNGESQRQAAWALGVIGAREAQLPLLSAVFTKSEPVRLAAARALHSLPQTPAEKPLPLPPLSWSPRPGEPLQLRQLLDEAMHLPVAASSSPPAWTQAPSAISAALSEGLHEHRDVLLRTLHDLAPASLGAKGQPLRLGLGPLESEPQKSALPELTELRETVGRALLPQLQQLASPPSPPAQPPKSAGLPSGGASPTSPTVPAERSAPLAAGDLQVRSAALQALGRLASLPSLRSAALQALTELAQTDPTPEITLQAAVVLSQVSTASATAASPAPSLPPLLDKLLRHPQRWVRQAALQTALQSSGASLVSTAALQQAATDPDGFTRELASQLLKKPRASL